MYKSIKKLHRIHPHRKKPAVDAVVVFFVIFLFVFLFPVLINDKTVNFYVILGDGHVINK